MKTTALTLTAAALALTGTVVLAQGHMGHHDPDADGDGNVTRAEMSAHADAMFARMDANGDGAVNAEDRMAHREEMFATADTDGDGELSQAEMMAMHEARMERRKERRAERMARHFERMDTDNSGGLSQDELRAMHEARGERGHGGMGEQHGIRGKHGMRDGHRGGPMAMLRMADSDGDKSITRAEFDAALDAHFAKADADGNGMISAEERKAMHEAMRAGHEAGHGPHGQ